MKGIKIIDIPKITDPRGHIGIIENDVVPFDIKRVYYLYDIPSDAFRGGHAHKNLTQLLIALSGSFEIHLENADKKQTVVLNKPNKGLLINSGIWREIDNFSSGSVCLVLASDIFKEADYIRDYDEFKLFSKSL